MLPENTKEKGCYRDLIGRALIVLTRCINRLLG
jgi:hypothetical protein